MNANSCRSNVEYRSKLVLDYLMFCVTDSKMKNV